MDAYTSAQIADRLLPGDILLYAPKNAWGWVIAVKTWQPVSHCETYIGGNASAAARDGIGVATYPLRLEQLAFVVRADKPLSAREVWQGYNWHVGVIGHKYDWLGLMSFMLARRNHDDRKMFCSEHTTLFQRYCGRNPFEGPAEKISPGMFLQAPDYHIAIERQNGIYVEKPFQSAR